MYLVEGEETTFLRLIGGGVNEMSITNSGAYVAIQFCLIGRGVNVAVYFSLGCCSGSLPG